MINTPWHAKINAQELFYFMILPVGGTLIDLAVSMKTRLELYSDAHGTLIFDNYDECSPKNHARTHRADITILFLVLKAASEEYNVIMMFYGDMNFLCLLLYSTKLAPRLTFRWWIGAKGPVHQICMQEPPCQVISVTRRASHWLWYIILVGQLECIRSEHFSEGSLSRIRTVYNVMILVQLLLISWKLYNILSVW